MARKKNKVTLIGMSESDPVLIDNVADGRIESGSKEAVTGGQLYDYTDQQMNLVLSNAKRYTDERFNDIVNNTVNNVVNETKSYTDIKFEALRYEIKEICKESKEAAAVGLAVSNLSYEDTPGSLSLSIGTGYGAINTHLPLEQVTCLKMGRSDRIYQLRALVDIGA